MEVGKAEAKLRRCRRKGRSAKGVMCGDENKWDAGMARTGMDGMEGERWI
jgi:hypothetical protein